MHAAGKIFVKTYLKAIRDFPNIWKHPICAIFIQQKRKVQTFRLAGRPHSPVPTLSGTPWSPHEENPEGGWSTYCNDFLSKQKKNSACNIKDEKEEPTLTFEDA